MQEFMATSERRAQLYWWFSTLFAAELSDEQIAEYDTYDVRSFLKSLSTLDPMREAVAELNDAIARLLVRTDRQLELAADFAGLFLVDGDVVRAGLGDLAVVGEHQHLLGAGAAHHLVQRGGRDGIDDDGLDAPCVVLLFPRGMIQDRVEKTLGFAGAGAGRD